MNSEERRGADYAEGTVPIRPSGQNAIALQSRTDELSQSQSQPEQQGDRVSLWRSHYEDTNSDEE
jgi:hypothetical protein